MTWTHCEVYWDLDFEPFETKTCFVVVVSSRHFFNLSRFWASNLFWGGADSRRVSLLRKLLEHSKILKRSAGRLAKGEMMEEDWCWWWWWWWWWWCSFCGPKVEVEKIHSVLFVPQWWEWESFKSLACSCSLFIDVFSIIWTVTRYRQACF